MSDNQDPLSILQNAIEKQEGAEPVQSDVDGQEEQKLQSQEEIEAREKRMADLKIMEEASLAQDQETIAQTREEFSQIIADTSQEAVAQKESSGEGNGVDTSKKENHQILQLKRLD